MILAPAGEDQSSCLVSVPARRSRTRSWECRVPYLMSRGSSSTSRRMILPLVTLMTVCPSSGKPYAGLGVRQRPHLVDRVQVAARQPVRVAFVQVAAQPDVPVRQREDRFALGQQVQVEPLLDQPPGLRPVRGLLDHRPSSSRSEEPGWPSGLLGRLAVLVEELGEVFDHDVRAVLLELLGLADPVDADHQGEVTRVARGHAGLGVLEDHRAVGRHLEFLAPRRGRCPAPACRAGRAPW